MLHRRRRFTWLTLNDRLVRNDGFHGFLFFGTFVALVSFLVFSIAISGTAHEDDAKDTALRELQADFSEATPEQQRELATSLLYAERSPAGTELLGDEEIKSLEIVEREGGIPEFSFANTSGWSMWIHFIWLFLACLWAYYSLVLFVTYAYQTALEQEFLADLPLRRSGKLFVFMLFTAIPFGWPFYIVSAIRLALHHEPEPRPEARIATPVFRQETFFEDTPDKARQAYASLRTGAWKKVLPRRIQEARERQTYTEADLRQLGEEIRAKQEELNDTLSTIRKLEAIQAESTAPPDLAHLDAEFDRVYSLPGIAAIRVINDTTLSLLLKARITYEEKRYDLGDWDLRLVDGAWLHTQELRSGVRRGWRGYPAYRLPEGNFCFGSRGPLIQGYIANGQFAEAIELAVSTMQSVNPIDYLAIPEAFKEADD